MKNSKPKKQRIVNDKTLIVAIDIGKMSNTGYYRYPDGTEGRAFVFPNTHQGFEQLWATICRAKASGHMERVIVGFEPTGSYGEPLVHFLSSRGLILVQVNPMHIKRLKELQGNSPNKTDQKDPKVIADVVALGRVLTVVIPRGDAAELRRLTQARERTLKRRTALLNQLQEVVFLCFPEFLQIMGDVKTKSARYLLRHYCLPEDVVGRGTDALAKELRRVSRGKWGMARAKLLVEAAQQSVGIREGRGAMVMEISHLLSTIEGCEAFVAQLEKELRQTLRLIPYSQFILPMKGIGQITVAGLIGEVGDFRHFNSIPEVLKHAGLDLYELSSGNHKGQRHISKRGRPLMRKLLFFAAMRAARSGGIMYAHYQRYLANGMKKVVALVAVARKLLCIIFALVRDQSTYQADFQRTQHKKAA